MGVEPSAHRFAHLPHLGIRLLSRALGGEFGRVADSPPALPEAAEIDTGEITLSFLRWPGPGIPLVLLHGLNNNAWIWARVAALLAEGRDVVSVSLRGHGSTSAPARGYALEQTTRDLVALLDRIQPGARVDLAGHSWGGKVALHLAATAGDRIRRLVLADPAPPQGLNWVFRAFPRTVTAAFRAERGPFPSRAVWEGAARRLIYLQHGDEIDRRIWAESFREEPDGTWRHSLPESAFAEILRETLVEDITPLLERIHSPVLLLRPTFSVSFLPGELGPLRRGLPQLEIRRVSGDHTFLHTNSLDTAREMSRFLERRPAG